MRKLWKSIVVRLWWFVLYFVEDNSLRQIEKKEAKATKRTRRVSRRFIGWYHRYETPLVVSATIFLLALTIYVALKLGGYW